MKSILPNRVPTTSVVLVNPIGHPMEPSYSTVYLSHNSQAAVYCNFITAKSRFWAQMGAEGCNPHNYDNISIYHVLESVIAFIKQKHKNIDVIDTIQLKQFKKFFY